MNRKVIYVASRYRADTEQQFNNQMEITKIVSREIVAAGYDVIVPHLYYPLFLDDNEEAERKAGIQSAIRLLDICDAVYVSIGLGVSKGMESEINHAKKNNMDIYYFRNINELKDLLKKQGMEVNEVKDLSKTPIEKCEDCLHNNTAKEEPFPIECGECSLFYASGFEKRPKLDIGQENKK